MSKDPEFAELRETMLDDFLQRHPLVATFVGGKYHKFDGLMESGTLEDIEKDILQFKEVKEQLLELDPNHLMSENRLDRELAIHFIEQQLFLLDELKIWEAVVTANGGPVGDVAAGLFPLFARDFAPFKTRVHSMIGRMRNSIDYLENTKNLWQKPVKLWTEIAIKECATTPGFFMVIGQALETQKMPEDLINEFQAAAADLTKSIQEYQKFLEAEILPRATHDWALGPEDFEKLLKHRKLPYSADEILKMGERFVKELKAEIEEIAKEIDPNSKSWDEVREQIKAKHPPDFEQTLKEVHKASEAARKFVTKKGLATIADGTKMHVIETPEYLRPLIPFAALMIPEMLAKKQESHYIVTRGADDSFLKEHNYPSIYNTSVHEGWPGHHHQGSHGNLFGNVIRVISSGIETIEGWAHYCEQMMLEEGFYNDKAFLDSQEVKFIQTLDVLWRAVRIVLDVKLHTKQISYEDGIEYLVAETGMAREAAVAEVTRYTMSPAYPLSYLIGKRMFLELRDQLKAELGDKFSLRWFHDIALRTGGVPFTYLKEIYMEKAELLKRSKAKKSIWQRIGLRKG
ncbi:MAG: DUF885 domain-containing protein [Candidatus Hodarchaeales archaeon]